MTIYTVASNVRIPAASISFSGETRSLSWNVQRKPDARSNPSVL